MRSIFFDLILALLFSCTHSTTQEWTRFRGPIGSGISTVTDSPSLGLRVASTGRSTFQVQRSNSPVLWGKQLFLTGDDTEAGKRSILGFDADSGKILWRPA